MKLRPRGSVLLFLFLLHFCPDVNFAFAYVSGCFNESKGDRLNIHTEGMLMKGAGRGEDQA